MKINFKNLEFGWVNLKIEHNFDVIVDNNFSSVYNSLTDLLDSLYQLSTTKIIETKIIFFTEPLLQIKMYMTS